MGGHGNTTSQGTPGPASPKADAKKTGPDGVHQTGFFQHFRMLGNGGLGDAQQTLQLTDAHGFVLQQFEDLDPVRIGKRFHNFDK
jgi:hypothetical protein